MFSADARDGFLPSPNPGQSGGTAPAISADFTLMLTAVKQRIPFRGLSPSKTALLPFLAVSIAAGTALAAAPSIVLGGFGGNSATITDKQQNFYNPFDGVTIEDPDGLQVAVTIRFSP